MAEDDLRHKLIQILKDGGTHEETLCALRTVIEQHLKAGAKRESILTTMEELRKSVLDEQEDILREAMDFFGGLVQPLYEIVKEQMVVRPVVAHSRRSVMSAITAGVWTQSRHSVLAE
jgi:hypothetical protein